MHARIGHRGGKLQFETFCCLTLAKIQCTVSTLQSCMCKFPSKVAVTLYSVSYFISKLSESLPRRVLKLSSSRLAAWPHLQQIFESFLFSIKYKLTRNVFLVILENRMLKKNSITHCTSRIAYALVKRHNHTKLTNITRQQIKMHALHVS